MSCMSASAAQRGRKYSQVVQAAREIFLTHGYEGASVSTIARTAGVSKATLYRYFPEKRLLFKEVVRAECDRQAVAVSKAVDWSRPPREVLSKVSRQLLDFLCSDFGRDMFRMSVAESERFPGIGYAYYVSGPHMARERLGSYLTEATERGELRVKDVQLAADQFNELCKADIFSRAIFNVQRRFRRAEKDRIADAAVETFLARYGT